MMQSIVAKTAMLIRNAPVIIGINGLDCAGKTTFADRLHNRLNGIKIKSALLHVDNFNNHDVQQRVYDAYRKGEFTESLRESYYHHSIHYDALAAAMVRSRDHHDVTIVEGVFLFKDGLDHLQDIRIFLSLTPAIARRRYRKRRQNTADRHPPGIFDNIWLPAFERYCRDMHPEDKCDFRYNG